MLINAIRDRGDVSSMNREFIAVWNNDGSLYCVSMGKKGSGNVKFEFPDNGATVIHNHPIGTTPSWRDFYTFSNGNMEKMEIVTKEGIYDLTKNKDGGILDINEIKRRFNNLLKDKENITFEEWKEVLDGSGYKISYSVS